MSWEQSKASTLTNTFGEDQWCSGHAKRESSTLVILCVHSKTQEELVHLENRDMQQAFLMSTEARRSARWRRAMIDTIWDFCTPRKMLRIFSSSLGQMSSFALGNTEQVLIETLKPLFFRDNDYEALKENSCARAVWMVTSLFAGMTESLTMWNGLEVKYKIPILRPWIKHSKHKHLKCPRSRWQWRPIYILPLWEVGTHPLWGALYSGLGGVQDIQWNWFPRFKV